MISDTVNKIGTSPTLKISAKAKAMKAEGVDVIDLSVGEPDFATPDSIKAAGIKAIEQNFTKYTANEGILELRKAVVQRMKEDYGLTYAPNEVIVSAGAKSSLFHLLVALVNEGDEVIIPAPYWVTYPEAVNLVRGKPVIVRTKEENGFLLQPDELKAAVSPATKALILNNPSNPTGATYSRKQLEALADIVRGEDMYVISDEIYAKLIYDDFAYTSFAALGEDIKKKTVVINGVSKTYSMTGWRIGYAVGPADIISGMGKIQSHTTSNAASISQKASLEALAGPQQDVARMAAEFQRRRNYVLQRLQTVSGLSCFKPQGAFYVFPNISSFYGKERGGMRLRNSYGMAYYLLKEARVAIIPGDAFGSDSHIRLSYATSMANLEKGLDRIVAALRELKPAAKPKSVLLSNVATRVRKSVPVEAGPAPRMRDALVAEMDGQLGFANTYEWNANINGVVLQLRTNVPHLNDFWMENWSPAQLEPDIRPHGVLYAVDGIPGREPRGFYSAETRTGVLINTDAYGPVRSLALGMVTDISESTLGVLAVRGMSVETDGQALTLVGPPGTRKTELFFDLLTDKTFRLHSSELAFVRLAGGSAQADCPERKLFLPTNTVELLPALAPLFDNSKCENVVGHKEACQDADCQRQDDCRLDRGSTYCYKASKEAHALLDPNWLRGPAGFSRRAVLRWIFLLRNDTVSPAVIKIEAEEALRLLASGETPGIGRGPSGKVRPFFNPHLLGATPDRIEAHKGLFRMLLQSATCFLFNSGAGKVEDLKNAIRGK
jgi:aspartate/methionine/tyrosine aminotransferase